MATPTTTQPPKYTAALVAQAFRVLNSTANPEERKQCNEFLTKFQVAAPPHGR